MSLQQLVLGKTGYQHTTASNWTPTINHTQKLMQNGLKPQHKTCNCKIPGREHNGKAIDIGLRNDFLDMTPKVQNTKAKMNKQDYIKLKGSRQQRKQSIE